MQGQSKKERTKEGKRESVMGREAGGNQLGISEDRREQRQKARTTLCARERDRERERKGGRERKREGERQGRGSP